MAINISIFGLGYVGSVTAACLAAKGDTVIGVDPTAEKVAAVQAGRAPVVEKNLSEIIAEGHHAGRLRATTDSAQALAESEISFICVGTPSLRNGEHQLCHVERVAADIGEGLRRKNQFHTVVLRSTVMPGTTESLLIPALERASGRRCGVDFGVCFNPEFLREGSAVADFLEPTITVLGAPNASHLRRIRDLYAWVPGRVFEASLATAETVKSICNVFHALKITFANEIGTLCKLKQVDTEAVFEIFKADTRLNASAAYLSPGFAFGGSCLPKDLRALLSGARQLNLKMPVIESIMPSNNDHIERAVDEVLQTGKKKVGVLGLSFKNGTDDLRESPLVHFIKRLLGEGCQIKIWDKDVALGRLVGSNRRFIEDVIPHIGTLLAPEMSEVVHSAEVVVIGTRGVDREVLRSTLRSEQHVVDLVNLEKAGRMDDHPFYTGICW